MSRRATLRNLLIGFVVLSFGGVGVLVWLIGSAALTRPDGKAQVALSSMEPEPSTETHEMPQSTAVDREPTSLVAAPPEVEKTPPPRTRTPVRWAADVETPAARALSATDAVLASDPNHPRALRDRARALIQLERWQDASDTLAHLIDVVPENAADMLEYGTLLARLSRWPAALEQFEKLVEIVPDEPRAWHNLAVAHQALGRLGEARRAWDRTIDLSPDQPEAFARRGEVLSDLGQWRDAAADFREALRLSPDSADAALNLATAQSRLGQGDDARKTVRELLEHHPRHVRAASRMAELCWSGYLTDRDTNARLRDDTIVWCRRSLEIDSDQPEIATLLGEALDRR